MEEGRIYIDEVPSNGTATALDLSYMMILELRDLYYQKYDAFVKCRTFVSKSVMWLTSFMWSWIRLHGVSTTVLGAYEVCQATKP